MKKGKTFDVSLAEKADPMRQGREERERQRDTSNTSAHIEEEIATTDWIVQPQKTLMSPL